MSFSITTPDLFRFLEDSVFKSYLLGCLSVFLLASPSVSASDTEEIPHHTQLLEAAKLSNLSHSPAWLKLLHYEPVGFSETALESAIHSPEFFLTANGRYEPEAELNEMVRSMLKVDTSTSDQHAVCRFPARAAWLKKQLSIPTEWIPVTDCPEFENWSFNGTTDSISIVFATGYLGNPASYYGHTLVKLNSRLQQKQTSLLDVSVNYGAIVPDNEDPLTYIVKGVTGGYDGGFSHIQYYFHTHNYGENELRDLWEYELDLPQEAVDLIVAHAWEVLGRKYTYYFFRKNCAYRMAELLQVVEGIDIIPENRPFTMPQSLISKLGSSKRSGSSLVRKVIYHPSRQSRLYSRFEALSNDKKLRVRKIIDSEQGLVESKIVLSYAEVDVLLDYYQYLIKSESASTANSEERYRQVLLYRYRMPPQREVDVIPSKLSPDQSRKPSRIELSGIHSSTYGSGLGVTLRPAYYDTLDGDDAHVSNSGLSMGELSIQFINNDWQIDRFDLINIESANTQVTGLPGDIRKAWMLRAGWVRPDLSCTGCVAPRIEGAWGRTFTPVDNFNVTAMLGASLQERRYEQNLLDATVNIRGVKYFNSKTSVLLERVVRIPVESQGVTHREDRAVLRYMLGRNADIRLRYKADQAEEFSLGLGLYF